MVKKKSNFIEQHIEKAVLLTAFLAGAYILYAFVIRSPNKLVYDNRQFGAGELDIYIEQQAEKLGRQLNREPADRPTYEPQSVKFLAKMEDAVDIDTHIVWPIPSAVESSIHRKYRIPEVGEVRDVSVEHIRAAAYVPKAEITPDNVDKEEAYELGDIDLVTVQASFDVAALADSFEGCFAGQGVPERWRDPVLARPVFAAVQLQRQRLGADGEWGGWVTVPRAQTDPYRHQLRPIIEEVNELPAGGITLRMLKLNESEVQTGVLQPEPYRIASAEERWFTPVLHEKYLAYQREKEAQERREAMAAEQQEQAEERERARAERERRRTTTAPSRSSGGYPGASAPPGYPGASGPSPSYGPAQRGTSREALRRERERRSAQQAAAEQVDRAAEVPDESALYAQLGEILLSGRDISKLEEPVVFWAHDDTAEPGGTYRYRIRLGVLNPVAGTGQVRPEDVQRGDRVILWSDFSEITEPVSIPRRWYMFPMNVQEAAKAVEIQICKYELGYWYSEQFVVKCGEVIGRPVKVERDKQSEGDKQPAAPETIDYRTGAMLVDVVAVSDWAGSSNLQPRHYFDMLYSFDGMQIETIAAKVMYWPDEIRTRYSELKALEKRPRVAFRRWSESGIQRVRRGPLDRRGYRERMMRERMMQERMRRQ